LKRQRKIKSKHPKKITSNWIITDTNQLWKTGVKYGYVAGEGRLFYVISIIDVEDRNIFAFHIDLSYTSEDAVSVIKNALFKRQLCDSHIKPVIRLDNGPQYISDIYNNACE